MVDEKKILKALSDAIYSAVCYDDSDDVYRAFEDNLLEDVGDYDKIEKLYEALSDDVYDMAKPIVEMLYKMCDEKAKELLKKRKNDIAKILG